jgi:hypothetical protein
MSIARHASAVEGTDRKPDGFDDVASIRLSRPPSRQCRTSISYDPAPTAALEQQVKLEPVGAYGATVERRLGQ